MLPDGCMWVLAHGKAAHTRSTPNATQSQQQIQFIQFSGGSWCPLRLGLPAPRSLWRVNALLRPLLPG